MSLIISEKFQHIHRVMNTNIDGNRKVPFAMTAIKGVGRRFAFLCCRKAHVDINKRAGDLSEDDFEKIVTIMQNPSQYKIPNWFLNRQKDYNNYSQLLSTQVDNKLREDLERLKKICLHRGLVSVNSTPRPLAARNVLSECPRKNEDKCYHFQGVVSVNALINCYSNFYFLCLSWCS